MKHLPETYGPGAGTAAPLAAGIDTAKEAAGPSKPLARHALRQKSPWQA